MSHTFHSLTLDAPLEARLHARTDAAFEAQVHAAARLRILRAQARRPQTLHARALGSMSHSHRWRRAACIAAGAAFGAGLLWPVKPPLADLAESFSATPAASSGRVLRGEMLASLDSPAQVAR